MEGNKQTKSKESYLPCYSGSVPSSGNCHRIQKDHRAIHLAWRGSSDLQSQRIPQAFQEGADRRRKGQTPFTPLLPAHLCVTASGAGRTTGNHSEPDRARRCGYDGALPACAERGQGKCGKETGFAVQKRKTDPSHRVKRPVQVQFKYGTVTVPDFYSKK